MQREALAPHFHSLFALQIVYRIRVSSPEALRPNPSTLRIDISFFRISVAYVAMPSKPRHDIMIARKAITPRTLRRSPNTMGGFFRQDHGARLNKRAEKNLFLVRLRKATPT
jgi:hypothetical protein